ncbi:serine hydrolase domain-containing protein [Robertkochia aurantiaca]|uniref:serine hydrolase domain-containing protein n=1 Tax=Robertkochia aurantiaca TaxID=2873700 RepID=UPI001CCC7599|nr:serine hydrolase domain-containing protein [Robertkochia sp. 3YJGBD-33]
MRILAFLLIITNLLSCTGTQKKQIPSEKTDNPALTKALDSVFRKNELLGLSVTLIGNGKPVYEGYFGTANITTQKPIDKSTIFRIASISKTFTATALMQLEEKGLVDLHTDVSDYLGWELKHPEFPEKIITLHQLLSHQSSIRDGEGYARFSSEMISEKLDIKELFQPEGAYFTPDMFAAHEPGNYFSYTNCTWGLIASIIEKVSGLTFDEYCRKNIFNPLNMKADFNVARITEPENLAALYRYKDGAWEAQADEYSEKSPESRLYPEYSPGKNGLIFGPQGSLRISAPDLYTFTQAIMNEGEIDSVSVLTKESVGKMMQTHWRYTGDNGDTWDNFFMAYGYGIHHLTNTESADFIYPTENMSGHPGIAYGLLSDLYFDPETRNGLIFITNGSKQSFEYGKKSSFYQVEEDVFQSTLPFMSDFLNKQPETEGSR